MSLSVVSYCIWVFLCCSFNLSLCCLSPFLLSNVTVSRSCSLMMLLVGILPYEGLASGKEHNMTTLITGD